MKKQEIFQKFKKMTFPFKLSIICNNNSELIVILQNKQNTFYVKSSPISETKKLEQQIFVLIAQLCIIEGCTWNNATAWQYTDSSRVLWEDNNCQCQYICNKNSTIENGFLSVLYSSNSGDWGNIAGWKNGELENG